MAVMDKLSMTLLQRKNKFQLIMGGLLTFSKLFTILQSDLETPRNALRELAFRGEESRPQAEIPLTCTELIGSMYRVLYVVMREFERGSMQKT